jgi:hypothetical protein
MSPSSLNLVCTMIGQGQQVCLSVCREDDELSHSRIENERDLILSLGMMTTRIGAQVRAQRVFEEQLRRAGINKLQFTGCRWLEVDG